jgi:hypothetical protein
MEKTLLFPWLALLGLAAGLSTSVALADGQSPSPQVLLEAARKAETVDGDPKAAIAQYEQIVKRYPNDRAVVADALVRMAGASSCKVSIGREGRASSGWPSIPAR